MLADLLACRHAEITSFLASLSKVLSIIEHRVVPPNINVGTLNPAIHWDEFGLRIPREMMALPASKSARFLGLLASHC
jgi:acyl transferase domain-containing protein